MPKSYLAKPLLGSAPLKGEVPIIAQTDFAALMCAKGIIGDDMPFTVHEGKRLVVIYRPAQRSAVKAENASGAN